MQFSENNDALSKNDGTASENKNTPSLDEKQVVKQRRKNTRILVWAIIGFTTSVVLAGFIAFFATLQSVETVNIPELREQHIVDAVIALQERGLIPQVQLRYHSDPTLKDHVLTQQPRSGTVVKIGKRVTLFVSKGVVIDSVKNYTGRNINDVRAEIQREFAIYEDSVSIESIRYIFSTEAVDTILAQDPPPQAEITGEIKFSFVVSKGEELRQMVVGDYVGMNIFLALDSLALNEIPFHFEMLEDGVADGVVVTQSPSPGSVYTPGLRVILSANPPTTQDLVFGTLLVEMPLFPGSLPIRLAAVDENGAENELFFMMHPGGSVSIPYLVPSGTVLRFFQADELILSKTITE